MDNFRRYRSKSSRPKSSTDGFIRTSSAKGPSITHDLKKGASYQPSPERRIGDFSKKEGFYPANRSGTRQIRTVLTKGQEDKKSFMDDTSNEVRPHTELHAKPKRKRFGRRKHDAASKKPRFERIRNLLFFNPFKRANWTKQRALAQCMVVVLLFAGIFGGRAWWLANKIFRGGGGAAALQENVDPSLLRGEGDGRVNILMLGRGGEGHEGPDLTDTIVIASINPIQKEAALLSIPRDLYVQVSGGYYTKINAVFANAKNSALANTPGNESNRKDRAEAAGLKAVEEVIEAKIGIPIHYHAMIDFDGFRKAIDTVGGVDVDVPKSGEVYERMWLYGRNYTLNVREGKQHFNGLRALAYSRSRYTSARGDHDRSERQRMILVALKNKVFSAGTYSNPLKISQLMSDFGNHIRTNLGVGEVRRLYEIGNEIPSDKIASVDLVTAPNDLIVGGMANGLSVQIPKAGIDNYDDIKHFVRNRLKDGFLAQEDATVAVYNGTMITGLAALTAKDLKSYGYNISTVGDAPVKGVQQTIIVDLRNGEKKYTKRYLENRFSTTTVGRLPDGGINPGNADFVIILGQNEQARLAN